jgi:hypothetical protein
MGMVELPVDPGVCIEIWDELTREQKISTLHPKPSVALKTGSSESVRSNNGRVNAFRRDRRGLVVDGFSF